MALTGKWVDKVDGKDDALAEHINQVAHAVIELEENGGGGGGNITIDTAMSDTSENAVQNKVIKSYVDTSIGNIETALDGIIAIQNELIGGDGE